MSGSKLFRKDKSRQSCSSQIRSNADRAILILMQCFEFGLLFVRLNVLLVLILGSVFAVLFASVPVFNDLMLPFMGESLKAIVVNRKVHKGEEGGKLYEIVYGYKFNEYGRQVDEISSEYVYPQTYERLAINEPVFVRCLSSFSRFFPKINRFPSFIYSQESNQPRFCKIENGVLGVFGRLLENVCVFISVLYWFALTLGVCVIPLTEACKMIVNPFLAASKSLARWNR